MVEVLSRANDEGIIVIVIGENKGLYPCATYVNFNYAGNAEKDAENFLTNYYKPDDDNIVLIFACNNDHGKIYLQALKDILDEYSNIQYETFLVNNPEEAKLYLNEWLNNHDNNLPDAIFNCCSANAQKIIDALEEAGSIFAPDGMPVYGADTDSSYDYEAFADLIADLIEKILSGEIVPTGDETYYVDF